MTSREQAITQLVDRFLAWPLPDSVCSDLCATKQGAPHRSGTTLLSATEAKQMIEYLLAAPALGWTKERPVKPGFYWFKGKHMTWIFEVTMKDGELLTDWGQSVDTVDGYWAGPIPTPLEVPT